MRLCVLARGILASPHTTTREKIATRTCTRGKCDRKHCIFDGNLGGQAAEVKGRRGKHSKGRKSPKLDFLF